MAAKRAGRGEETRERIVEAAIQAFAHDGFEGASTRRIAELAGANQGLITYHFGSKEKLWKAAVDTLLGGFREALMARAAALVDADLRSKFRLLVFFFVRYAAQRPEQMRLMVQEGKSDSPRTDWVVDRHLKPVYALLGPLVERAQREGVLVEGPMPNLFYALVGATSLIFTHAQECTRLTGQSPMDDAVIEAHAETVCRLFLRGEAR
ncbi:MAG: TetR/AcrR family transcriptional regulator [Myxococcota bacterium]